jgi:hypothetical protein
MRCRPNLPPQRPVDELTREELLHELLVDPITQIANRRAWDEMEKGPAMAWIDADGPEWVADENARALCERPLQAIAAALQDAMPGKVAYFFGDIFVAHALAHVDLELGISRALKTLSMVRIQMTRPDGAMTVRYGLGFSYGKAADLRDAEFALQDVRRGTQGKGFVLHFAARAAKQ